MLFLTKYQEMLINCGMWSNCHGLEYLFTSVKSWSTPCNADVKQFLQTVAIQLNISSVIQMKAKSSKISQFIQ